VRGWLRRSARRTLHEFRTRLARFQLQQRRQAKTALLDDPVIRDAMAAHAAEHGMSDAQVRRRVETYIT